MKPEFEVISNSDNSEMNSSEDADKIESESINEENESIDSTSSSDPNVDISNAKLMYDLYKDNRMLQDTIKEHEHSIAKLEERNFYLMNSNLFWSMCAVGSFLLNIVSLNLK